MSTMREVAALAGVSGKTVSRVINGDRYVSAEVRERVQRAVEELGYVPNMMSQTFRTGRDSAIGVAVPDLADPFFGAIVQAIAEQARSRATAVLVTGLGTDPADEQAAVESLLRRSISGLVIAPNSTDQSYLRRWQPGPQLVFIDRPPRRVNADSVIEDDVGGARCAVELLLARGHRRIAFFGNATAVITTRRRLDGYRAAFGDAGIQPDPLLEFNYADIDEVADAMRRMLARSDPPTAIFSSNSQASVTLVAALHDLGRTGVGFVSFGDFPMAAALRPAVTVVDQDPALLGRTAADRLFTRIEQPLVKRRRQLVLPVQLRIRETTPTAIASSAPSTASSSGTESHA